jgi:glucokinase
MSDAPVLGIDLGGTKVETALVTASGTVLAFHRHPTRAEQGPDRVVDDIASCAEACLDQAAHRAVAAGIGVAAQIDPDTGRVRTSPNLGWTDVPLQSRLEAALDLPVVVDNDVRAITWGVWQHGAGQGTDDLVVVFVGTGIGGGVVTGGRVLAGHDGVAGELGHRPIHPHGRSCRCPNQGCWEAYAGGWAIADRARDAVADDPEAGAALRERAGSVEDITGRTVHAACADGDPLATDLVSATGEYLGIGLTGIVNAFNPERVVLGGGVIEGHPAYIDTVRTIVGERALEVAADGLEIVPSDLGGRAGVVGAATKARRRHVASAAG